MITGKQFEQKFKENWLKCFPNSFLLRLPDQISGFKYTSANLCDFIGYVNNNLFLLECKTHKGASIPFENITQYDKMLPKVGIPGIRCGVILWLYEKDVIYYIPISTIQQMKKDGKKSVGIKAVEEGYNIKIIPTTKKRIFLDGDYSILVDLLDKE